jgi:hypothetical protein
MIALLKGDKGIAMPSVVIIIAIVTLLGFTAVSLTENQDSMGKRYEATEGALSIAEAGINEYLWRLNKDSRFYGTDEGIKFVKEDGNPKVHDFQSGQYILEITEPTVAEPTIKIKSTGWLKDDESSKYAVEVEVRKRRFVQQIYLSGEETNDQGESVWWTTDDIVNGPFHTNGTLNINGKPKFLDRVTYVKGIKKYTNQSEPICSHGPPEKVEPMVFPTTNQQLKTQAQYNGYYFNGRTSIMLSESGIKIRNKDGAVQTITDLKNGVIYVDGNVSNKSSDKWKVDTGNAFVSGKLNGRLTIAAANDIYITGYDPTEYKWNSVKNYPTGGIAYFDTTFDENGNVLQDGDDMLGLIADQYVRILHYGWFGDKWSTGGWGGSQDNNPVALNDITIHGAIFALNKSYEFEDHEGGKFGTITLNGSICQNRRGAVGTFSGNTTVSGYANKNYIHDPRMAYDTPPHFLEPTNAGWEIVSWKKVTPSE